MTLGEDIEEVIEEIGTEIVILRDSGNISGEYLDFDLNTQVTKPFIREFFLESLMPFNSQVVGGDVIEFSGEERRFLVTNYTRENFEGAAISTSCVLYKCNVSGELFRPSGEVWDANYRNQTAWETIKSNCYALLTDNFFGSNVDQGEDIGQISVFAQTLFIPTHVGSRELDRYQAVSGEYYKIETVERRKYDGIDVCHLVEDTRE